MFGKATIGIEGDTPYASLLIVNIALIWVGHIVRVIILEALSLKQLSKVTELVLLSK